MEKYVCKMYAELNSEASLKCITCYRRKHARWIKQYRERRCDT